MGLNISNITNTQKIGTHTLGNIDSPQSHILLLILSKINSYCDSGFRITLCNSQSIVIMYSLLLSVLYNYDDSAT